ncbi:hypothetical protein [Bacteroides sp.]|uniref:hypothetical protein n=1 Tax=Bacteroides sp. TaxID=29523 RepID=UPI003AB13B49
MVFSPSVTSSMSVTSSVPTSPRSVSCQGASVALPWMVTLLGVGGVGGVGGSGISLKVAVTVIRVPAAISAFPSASVLPAGADLTE